MKWIFPRVFILLAVASFLFAGSGYAQVFDKPVTPTGFGTSDEIWIQPVFSATTQTTGGTQISLNNDLGFNNRTMVVPHFWYRWPHGQILDVRYQQYEQTALQTLTRPLVFQSINFPAGQTATSNFKLQWADISYEYPIAYDVYPPENSYLNAVVTLKALRGSFSMTNAAGQSGNHSPIMVPVPLLGLHGKYRILQDMTAEFRVAGMQFGALDTNSYAYDLEGGFNFEMTSYLDVGGKYRYSSFYNSESVNNGLNSFGYRFAGPALNVNLHF